MLSSSDPTTHPTEPSPAADQDEFEEAAIMRLLLIEHPAQLTAHELAIALSETGEPASFVDDALRRLINAGLIHRNGEFVVPSRPVVYFDQLPVD